MNNVRCVSSAGTLAQDQVQDYEALAKVLAAGDPDVEVFAKHRLTVHNVRQMFAASTDNTPKDADSSRREDRPATDRQRARVCCAEIIRLVTYLTRVPSPACGCVAWPVWRTACRRS